MCSVLVKEPFNCTLEEISKLCPRQVRWIYFRSDEDNKPSGQTRSLTPKEQFWKVWREWRGHSEEQVRVMWDASDEKKRSESGGSK